VNVRRSDQIRTSDQIKVGIPDNATAAIGAHCCQWQLRWRSVSPLAIGAARPLRWAAADLASTAAQLDHDGQAAARAASLDLIWAAFLIDASAFAPRSKPVDYLMMHSFRIDDRRGARRSFRDLRGRRHRDLRCAASLPPPRGLRPPTMKQKRRWLCRVARRGMLSTGRLSRIKRRECRLSIRTLMRM
jgi:hypothetical protein